MKVLFFILLIPVFAFCNFTKDEIIQEFSTALLELDVERANHALYQWETYFPEDKEGAEVCRSFLLLSDGKINEGKELFEDNFAKIKDQLGSLTHQEQVRAMFYYCLGYSEETFLNTAAFPNDGFKVFLCKGRTRFWKLKAFTGALLTATGVVVSAFNPLAGGSLIASGVPMFIQGIEDTLDEHDDFERKLRERQKMEAELNRAAFYSDKLRAYQPIAV